MKLVTWKRTPRDLDEEHVKPMYKTKRTLRRELDEAHTAREAAIEERKDVQRLLTQETQIAQDAIRDRDEARRQRDLYAAEYEQARKTAWYWKNSHHEAGKLLAETRKARDEALAELARFGWTPTDKPGPADDQAAPDEHVEDLPAVFIQLATEHKAEHPEVEGKTTTFYRLTPEQEAELRKDLPDVAAWDAFTTSVPTVPTPKRRRAPAARKPAGGS